MASFLVGKSTTSFRGKKFTIGIMERRLEMSKEQFDKDLKSVMYDHVTAHTVADTIRDKVIQSLPKHQLDELILAEYDKFFKPFKKDQWSKEEPSPFQTMVQKALEQEIKERITESVKEELKKFNVSYDFAGKRVVADAVKELAPHFMNSIIERMIQDGVQNMKSNGFFSSKF